MDNLWWGVFICAYSVLWIAVLSIKLKEEHVDLDDPKPSATKSKFAKRLEEIIKEKYNQQ